LKVAVVLGLYTLLLSIGAGPVLRRCSWLACSPRWGVAAWQAVTTSIVLGVAASGFALAVPSVGISGGLSTFLRECVLALRAQYRGSGGGYVVTAGSIVAFMALAGAVGGVALELWQARRLRRSHGRDLLVATCGGRQGAPSRASASKLTAPVIVETQRLAAYCLPGRRGQIVLTRGAVEALNAEQMAAVLAHERAHLAGRHHLLLGFSSGLARAFWFVPVFCQAREATSVLVEMVADDRAARAGSPHIVAGALLALASPATSHARGLPPQPVGVAFGALGAVTTAAGTRVRRLLDMPAPLRPVRRAATATACLALVLTPFVVLLAPALALAATYYCPA
jgi:beta-lactamase regulating signal transducer with metallopeptidase domain